MECEREPAPYGRYLYLGMLQVHGEYQCQGVGRAMKRRRGGQGKIVIVCLDQDNSGDGGL